jgi:exonuclease SbcC
VSLTIEGLTSFKTRQPVDFSELDLFVITGPTGSGKSSILDAVTFALYGDIARVNDNELRHLISHGASFARVSLDFEVDGTLYRVARRMGRKEAQRATLERVDDGVVVSEVEQSGVKAVNKRLEEIVGLDFDTFTKAVLLPQGAFDKFLKGNVGERRHILMRLLDLGRYEAAGRLARQEAARLEAIIGERAALIESNYQGATGERLAEFQRAVKTARKRQKELEQARGNARKIAQAAASAAKQRSELEQAVADIEDAVEALEPLREQWPNLAVEEHSTAEAFGATSAAFDAAEKVVAKARLARDATVRKTGDAAKLAIVEQAATNLSTEQRTINELDEELVQARTEAEAAKTGLSSAAKEATDAEGALKRRIAEAKTADAGRDRGRAVLLHAEAAEALRRLAGELEKATAASEKAHKQADKAREQRRHLEQEHMAAALRAGLAPGDSCPVCAAVIEAVPPADSSVEGLLVRALEDVASAEELERKRSERVVALTTQVELAEQALAHTRAALDGKVEALSVWEAQELLAGAENAAAEAEDAREAADARVRETQQRFTGAQSNVGSAEAKITGSERLREAAHKRFEAARATLLGAFANKLPKDLIAEIAKRRAALSAADDAVAQAESDAAIARGAREEAQTAQRECAKRLALFDQSLATSQTAAKIGCQALARLLKEREFPSLPAATDDRAAFLQNWGMCCASHLAEAKQALHELDELVSGAVVELRGLASGTAVELKAADPSAIADEFDHAATIAHSAVVGAEKDVETQKGRIAEREKLEADIVKDRRRCALYQTLARELRTDRFIDYVLAQSMSLLAVQASDELLKISDGRYSLVADEGSFEVVDHHNADERRSVATLSGGETFLASLSLALALSVGLRELAGVAASRLEAIFIDEGFGNLDSDTLDVVVDALERLREGDRMVGVISHVETLAQRIPTGLAVQPNGGSSRIVPR